MSMKFISIALGLLCVCVAPTPADEPTPSLPEHWHGTWSGQFTVHAPDGKSFERSMELEIAPIKDSKSLKWRIVSEFKGKKTVRDYELVPHGEKAGHFAIDEKNGIVIDARLIGNALYSYFKDNDMLTTVKYERRGASLFMEMASVITKDPRVSEIKSDDITIHSYQLGSVQVGELKKKSQ